MWVFIRHEMRYFLTRPMVWIFLGIVSLLVMGAVSSDQVQIGGGVGSVYKNSPSVVQNYYGLMSLICLLMTTAFMNAAANRDFSTGMHQFVFTSPIRRRDYYFGKFIGAFLVALIPLLGVSIGALIGPLMPWAQPERFGPIIWSGHVQGLISLAIPNTLIAGVLLYSLAVVFRNNMVSFVGAMLLLVLYAVSQGFTQDLEQEWLANLLDPFGFQPLRTLTKYLTVDELNAAAASLQGQFLLNRLLWMGAALLLLLGLYTRFSFSIPDKKASKSKVQDADQPALVQAGEISFKHFSASPNPSFSRRAWFHQVGFESRSIFRNQTFIILLLIGLINLVASLTSFTTMYGTKQYPVTYDIIDTIRGAFYLFLIGIITFYAGVLVWKERDASIHEIADATPASTALFFSAKLVAMLMAVFVVLFSTIVVGVITQVLYGYYRFELDVYFKSLLLMDMLEFSYLVVIALLLHYLINNRYIGYFAFVVVIILNSFIWSVLNIDSNMVSFGAIPYSVYSDMNGFGPFVPGMVWFNVYWLLISLILCFVIYYFYVRGKEYSLRHRLQFARERFRSSMPVLLGLTAVFLLCGGFVFYNTQVLNTYYNNKQRERLQVAYENQYKQYAGLAQPRWISFEYAIDLFPASRDLEARVKARAVNRSAEPIAELHFTMPEMPDTVEILMDGARLTLNDSRHSYRIYTLDQALQPGDTLAIDISLSSVTRGFENEVSFTELTQNGSFFNNFDIMPVFGYNRNYELSDKNKRIKYKLDRRERMPRLDDENIGARQISYISSDADWVELSTVISTEPDQTAVAPGRLLREWTEGERRFFHYELEKSSLNFYSFISARYEVTRERWGEVDLEVYHMPEHAYNVPNMLESMRKSLAYYTANFGPYYHSQARIIEFPRYASFAQAFPGTMPYSEGIGFIADLRDVKGDDIDMVYYVVAHEMAHQYWAHQLIGAYMQGSEWMSEGFSQYSALMVMEEEYGRDKMRKFLKYEMNEYLRGRGNEYEAERPMLRTEGQGYIHYNKASVVLYYLKEMIGEEKVNSALASLIDEYGYRPPPYPTAMAALRAFEEVSPDSLQYLMADLFENITLFSNRMLSAQYSEQEDGKFRVVLKTHSEKFRADSLGKENPMALNDYIDLGIFGEPAKGEELGEPLWYQRVKMEQAEGEFVVVLDSKPAVAGIDPYLYLVDRIPSDNIRRVGKQ